MLSRDFHTALALLSVGDTWQEIFIILITISITPLFMLRKFYANLADGPRADFVRRIRVSCGI